MKVPACGGGVAEWSNALAWKAGIPQGIASSNPSPSARLPTLNLENTQVIKVQ